MNQRNEPTGPPGPDDADTWVVERSTPVVFDFLPPRIPGYQLHEVIGSGAMGVVYRAASTEHGSVAVKVLRPEQTSVRTLERFAREASYLRRLNHPGIARIHEAGATTRDEQCVPFIAMEWVDGDSLRRFVALAQPPLVDRLELFVKICDAVQHAHEEGIVHRDLKPENILVDDQGNPRVVDFGLARAFDVGTCASVPPSRSAALVGTLRYMSPEQLADSGEIDHTSDVYALGVVLYELLSGRPPYEGDGQSFPEMIRAICHEEPTPLGSVDSRFRGDLEAIVMTTLEKQRDRRYPSARALSDDIRRYLRQEKTIARPPNLRRQLEKLARRHPRSAVAAVATTAVLVLALGFALHDLRRSSRHETQLTHQVENTLEATDLLLDQVETLAPLPHTRGIRRDTLEQVKNRLESASYGPQIDARLATLARCQMLLADLDFHEGDLTAALERLLQARDLRAEYLSQHPEDVREIAALSITLVRIGDIAKQQEDFENAREWYERALAIDLALTEQEPDDLGLLDNLSWSYERLGHLARVRREPTEARRFHEARHRLALELVERDPDNGLRHFGLSASHGLMKRLGSGRDVDVHCRKSLEHARRAVKLDCGNLDYRRSLISALLGLLALELDADHLEAALAAGREALSEAEYVLTGSPSILSRQQLILSLDRLARVEVRGGSPDEARKHWTRAREIGLEVQSLQPSPRSSRILEDIELHLRNLGESRGGASQP